MPFTTLPTLPHLLRRQVVYTISYHWRSLYFIIFYYRVCFIVAITADMLVRWGKLSGLCVCQLVVALLLLPPWSHKIQSLQLKEPVSMFALLNIDTEKPRTHTYTIVFVYSLSSPHQLRLLQVIFAYGGHELQVFVLFVQRDHLLLSVLQSLLSTSQLVP